MLRVDHGLLAAARLGISRNPRWPALAKAHLAKHPHCACCLPQTHVAAALQVHHIFPFHYCVALGRPDLELDARNLITLCETASGKPSENHHLLVGHLGSFLSGNLGVRADAAHVFFGMSAIQIRGADAWKVKVALRLKPLEMMGARDKETLRHEMDRRLPRRQ